MNVLRARCLGLVLALSACSSPLSAYLVGEEPSPIAAHIPMPAPVSPAPSTTAAKDARSSEPDLADTWSLAVKEDGAACRAELKELGFAFTPLPDRDKPDKSGCGIPHGVVLHRGPTGIVYEPSITVDCSLARALGSFERIVQEEAATNLGQPITKIGNLGAYACRPRNSRKGSSLSAHAFGSAVDVTSFFPRKGSPAVIVRDYPDKPGAAADRDARQRFLKAVYGRLRRHEADLTYAVGPDFNASHRDHFHLDRGGWYFWFHR